MSLIDIITPIFWKMTARPTPPKPRNKCNGVQSTLRIVLSSLPIPIDGVPKKMFTITSKNIFINYWGKKLKIRDFMGIYWVQKSYYTGPTNHQSVYRMKNFVLASGRFLVVPYSNIIIPMCRVQQSSPGFSLSSMTFLRKSTFLLSHIWKFRINLK